METTIDVQGYIGVESTAESVQDAQNVETPNETPKEHLSTHTTMAKAYPQTNEHSGMMLQLSGIALLIVVCWLGLTVMKQRKRS